ncbi:hypothetical protein ACJIZ3_003631 [Penstemon smallii]|uniref:ATP-dependent DNA helicase n=1 Tax=Penstemon smallii TaxID=265156 RepID=A0ABD3UDL3_9LAMI
MYIKLETSRLDYFRSEQRQRDLRTESYQGIIDSIFVHGETDPSNIGQRVVLLSSFIGGPRDMRRRYVNAMALVQRFGKPDVFLTMTCNPAWVEIRESLLPGQKPDDRPDLIARVFKAKLEELKNDLVKKKLFGQVAAYVYTVEYQKRGLPHAHWIIILDIRHKIVSPTIYDEIISAELPDTSHPFLRAYVVKHMMHGPCGESNPSNACMRDGECKNHYPKDFSNLTTNGKNSYPVYRRHDDCKFAVVRNHRLYNRSVVPYNPFLLAKFDCHINVEICADVKLVKYLYKYIHKCNTPILHPSLPTAPIANQDEIQAYQPGRWVCAPEAFWRIFAFLMSEIHPPVIVMPVHLPNHQPLRFGLERTLEQVVADPRSSKTMLTEFFYMNDSDPDAARLNLLYKEFPEYFVWDAFNKKWKLRQRQVVVGRLCTVNPFEGERYFERLLLVNVRCPRSFDDLLTVNGQRYATFHEAAISRGLLESDEYVDGCLAEAVLFQAPHCLRVLFALLLIYGITADPQVLWDRYYSSLSEDFARSGLLTATRVLKETVDAINIVLTSMDKSIDDFPIRFPSQYTPMADRTSSEYRYECSISSSLEDVESIGRLNVEQQIAFDKIVCKIDRQLSGVFFLDGPGGTGKTFLYRALLAYVHRKGGIALAVASSGVAASLLPGGRTAHSRFKLPLDVDDDSNGKISKQTSLAKMIVESRLIIWDEASMASRHSIEALDGLLRDLCDKRDVPFGGKIVLFGGDFRQTLPIVVRGSRTAMIEASFVSSKLWRHVVRLHLTQNMRAREDPSFVQFLLRVGDGEEPYVIDENIRIPSHMLAHFIDAATSLDRLIESVYPSFVTFFSDPHSMMNRAVLTPKNDCVDEINDLLLCRFPGQMKEYISFNRTIDSDHTCVLNSHCPSTRFSLLYSYS